MMVVKVTHSLYDDFEILNFVTYEYLKDGFHFQYYPRKAISSKYQRIKSKL